MAKTPRAIGPDIIARIADDWDMTAELCRQHRDRTATAAFHTCANQLRRAALLPERTEWDGLDSLGGAETP